MAESLPYLAPPYIAAEVARIEDTLLRQCPSRQWEIRVVTFPTTAGQSLDIAHGLNPSRPEFIDWIVLQTVQPALIYQPINVPFQDGLIRLVSTQPGASAVLLLMVTATLPGRSPLLGAAIDTTATSSATNRFYIPGINGGVYLNGFGGSSSAVDPWRSASITFDTSSIDWEIGVDDSGSGSDNALVFFDKTNDVVAMQLHLVSGAYYLQPAPGFGGSGTVNLGRDASGERWDNLYVQSGIFEQTRAVAAGKWTTPSYSAGNFTASAGTWTVDSGDVTTYAYTLVGNTMTVLFEISATDVSATPTELRIAIPGGYTATKQTRNPIVVIDAGGVPQTGQAVVGASGTTIRCFKDFTGSTAWTTTAADNTYVLGQITFEVQ